MVSFPGRSPREVLPGEGVELGTVPEIQVVLDATGRSVPMADIAPGRCRYVIVYWSTCGQCRALAEHWRAAWIIVDATGPVITGTSRVDNAVVTDLGITVFPYYLLLDREGRIVSGGLAGPLSPDSEFMPDCSLRTGIRQF